MPLAWSCVPYGPPAHLWQDVASFCAPAAQVQRVHSSPTHTTRQMVMRHWLDADDRQMNKVRCCISVVVNAFCLRYLCAHTALGRAAVPRLLQVYHGQAR